MFSLLPSVHFLLSLCLLEPLSIYCLAVLFSLWSVLLLPSSTTFFFSLPYILGIRSFFFPILIPFSQLHPFFYTLHTLLLSSLLSLFLLLSSSMLLGIGHTVYFSATSQEGILVLGFHGFGPLCLYTLYNPHMLLLFPLLTIPSQAEVCL